MFRVSRAALVALGAVMFAFADSTCATVWHSGFDPGGQITFSGGGTFQFDDGCLGASGSLGATYCHLQLLGATLNLTDNGTGNAAQLNFGSQLINALPGNPIQPGTVFAIVLNDTAGTTPGLVLSTTAVLGAAVGNGQFAVPGLKVVATTSAIAALQFTDFSHLFANSDFTLSGFATGTFVGGHGGIHNFVLTFNSDGTWTFNDLTNGNIDSGPYAAVVSMNILGGELAGLNTGLVGPVFVNDASNSLFGPWWLEWQAGVTDPVSLIRDECDGDVCFPVIVGTDTHVTFDEISGPGLPEPATLALILGGCGAAWLARRRKRAS